MLRMFRLRRYRVFLIVATAFTFLAVRFARQRHYFGDSGEAPIIPGEGFTVVVPNKDAHVKSPPAKTALPPIVPARSSRSISRSTKAQAPVVHTLPPLVIPERKIKPVKGTPTEQTVVDIRPGSPAGDRQVPLLPDEPVIHYSKVGEHFPVPTGSIIQLPTSLPAKIPKIQFKFNDETTDAKIDREKKQKHVKGQFQKSWNGYKKYAWMHDELSPQSGKFRDPFCGWAATLVDSLDTLWIMGLEEEFEIAVNAVNKIDFTTTTRNEIPVFETTIRYLGGLLGAYDVSGGKFKVLLDKAVELADVLMGTFDTPNRMPQLYFDWKPAFTSQPHRASTASNLAELGSLTLEFTRLAQLTKEPRYYDAVARISIALGQYQDRGTKLGGIFPERVDASGCNNTARPPTMPFAEANPSLINPAVSDGEPEGYKPNTPEVVREPLPVKSHLEGGPSLLEMDVVSGTPEKAHFSGWEDQSPVQRRAIPEKAEGTFHNVSSNSTKATRENMAGTRATRANPLADWDCVPQGLDSATLGASDKFSMAGSQDSTYEYFTKQYLLLGGRVDLYRKMYLETIKAVKKHLLYRPMLPGNPDILFTGSISTYSNEKESDFTLSGDVEHLTCFIGGMVGMAAKVFDLEGDLEIAQKLAEGCVWAYGSTPSGIMPEAAKVLPCKNAEHCNWNSTVYELYLDPDWVVRDEDVQRYEQNQKKLAMDGGLLGPEAVGGGSRRLAKRYTTAPTSSYDEKVDSIEAELENGPVGRQSEVTLGKSPASAPIDIDDLPADPDRPLSHKEYIKTHLKNTRLPTGMVYMRGEAYHLRPEAIESVWYMYRMTGDPIWQAKGWVMYENIIKATTSVHGHSAIFDVTTDKPGHTDEMESFWLSETLKYFYLLFSTPDTISLDDWVLNTEAHPFRRQK